MTFVGGAVQGVAQPGRGAGWAVGGEAEPLRDGVGRLEPDARHVARQPVRVGADGFHGLFPVGFIDADGPRGARAVGVEEHHDLAYGLAFRPCGLDAAAALGADLVHFFQARGVAVNDVEDPFAETLDQLFRQHGTDAADEPTAEVALDPLTRVRRGGAQGVRLELEPVAGVARPAALRGDGLPGVGAGQVADDGAGFWVPAPRAAQDGDALAGGRPRRSLASSSSSLTVCAVPIRSWMRAASGESMGG